MLTNPVSSLGSLRLLRPSVAVLSSSVHFRLEARSVLMARGASVSYHKSVRSFEKGVRTHLPDLVVLDESLVDGVHARRRVVRLLSRHSPVVLSTHDRLQGTLTDATPRIAQQDRGTAANTRADS